MSNNKRSKAPKPSRACVLCGAQDTKRIDIAISWFRGDDVVLWACKEHRKPIHETDLLKTPQAIKQLGETS